MLHLRDTSNITGYTDENPTSPLALLSLTKASYYSSTYMGEEATNTTFLIDLINVLDRVMVENDIKLGTVEQISLFKKYLAEADTGLTEEVLLQLDDYLGGYLGEENEIYYRHVYRADIAHIGETND